MSNPPPIQPGPPLDYRPPQPSRKNTPGLVVLRIFLGAIAGFGASLFGLYLISVTNRGWTFFLPIGFLLAIGIFVAVYFRRFGYITGLILGPFILVACIFTLLLILCGGLIVGHHP